MNKKKLLVYAHYFYPDVASTGQILTELCCGLEEYFEITVICAIPSYSGKINKKYKEKKEYIEKFSRNIKVIRVWVPEFEKKNKLSRIKNLVTYFLNSVRATFKLSKQDYIFTISQPPILGGILGVIGKWIKGGKLIYNIQDFNPEQTMAVGYSKNKIILGGALLLDKFTCRRADNIIVVGRDMQETLKRRFSYNRVPQNTYINNWINEKEIIPMENSNEKVNLFKSKYNLHDKFIIMYSGNIGLYYDLENIIKVLEEFKDCNDVVFPFVGEGTVKDNIESYVKEKSIHNVIFIPYQKKEDLVYSLNAADVHWVVNAKGIKGISVPSKLYGVMAVGKMVLGVLEKGSEARMIIEESDCGVCIEPGDYNGIGNAIRNLIRNREGVDKKGKNGREYLERNLTKEVSINKYKESILKL